MSGPIAPRTYHPGDLIYSEEKAFADVLARSLKSEACEACHERSSDLKSCTRCQEVKYCDKACQKADWSDHKLECEHLKNLPEENDFVRLLGKVILKVKGKNWKNIQRRVVNTNITFYDIEYVDTGKERSTRNILFYKAMKEFTRRYIGEQNMPSEDDFCKILDKVRNSVVARTNDKTLVASYVFLGISKFEHECIPNANYEIYQNSLKVWACKEIKKGKDKISIRSRGCLPVVIQENVVTMNNNCKCSDCSLPYGKSILRKIIDETKAFPVICETENLLNKAYYTSEYGVYPSAKEIDDVLRKHEEVLGRTHELHLKLLELKCFVIGDRPHKLKGYLKELEVCTRMVYGKHSLELREIYRKHIAICIELGDVFEAAWYIMMSQRLQMYNEAIPRFHLPFPIPLF